MVVAAPSPIAPALTPLAVPLASLNPDPANARRHDRKNIDAIKASLARWGQRAPLVVQRDGMIVRAGNGRLEAMKELGWTEAACLVVDDSEIEAVAFAIADNRTAELADWDDDALARLLETLPDADVALLGFDGTDLERILNVFSVDGSDEAPNLSGEDRAPIQQMAFILHDDQAEIVKRAIRAAIEAGPFIDTGNENKPGNALARIAEAYIGAG
jgi:ParB-like chromosome segregation protein Spo0J